MVVRDKIGRKRYIVFSIASEEAPSMEDFGKAVVGFSRKKGMFREIRPKLIDYDGEVGILRCVHTGRDEALDLLNSITEVGGTGLTVRTIKTSGTLRKARAVAKGLASAG